MAAVASLSARAAALDPKQVDPPVCAHLVDRERWNSRSRDCHRANKRRISRDRNRKSGIPNVPILRDLFTGAKG
jgi:hypothetical protein